MLRFRTRLIPGKKRPYTSWTFLVIPPDAAASWGPGQKPVRGTIAGQRFKGTASRGEGVVRVPIPHELREQIGVSRGDIVEVSLELDKEPRSIQIPGELRAVFDSDPEAAHLYASLPPSHRRAWTTYIAEAKRAATRTRRASHAAAGIRARAFPGKKAWTRPG